MGRGGGGGGVTDRRLMRRGDHKGGCVGNRKHQPKGYLMRCLLKLPQTRVKPDEWINSGPGSDRMLRPWWQAGQRTHDALSWIRSRAWACRLNRADKKCGSRREMGSRQDKGGGEWGKKSWECGVNMKMHVSVVNIS